MVDPNRKINRLTAEDIAFLDECEELFGNRFNESDEEFNAHCEKGFPEPPVVMNFSGGSGQGQNSSYRGRYNNDNRHNYRGGRGGHRGYNRRETFHRPGGSGGAGSPYRNYRTNRNYNERNDERATNVRRDYGKFVAASNSERTRGGDSG